MDQSHSDFQKALMYMTKHGLLPAIICGISGGHIDHIVNNVNILPKYFLLLYSTLHNI